MFVQNYFCYDFTFDNQCPTIQRNCRCHSKNISNLTQLKTCQIYKIFSNLINSNIAKFKIIPAEWN